MAAAEHQRRVALVQRESRPLGNRRGAQFYGAALAAAAIASVRSEYRNRVGVREHVAALESHLASARRKQPVHNRLALLWAGARWSGLLAASDRQETVAEALGKQQPDGGWTLASLGPWKERRTAPPSEGSNGYATGFTALVLQEAGCRPTDPAISRAPRWLASHQDPQSGAWAASSMNKQYEPGSVQIRFMQDAATAFAALTLLE